MECPHCHSQVTSHSKHCKRCGGAIPSGQYLLEECGLTESSPAVTPATSAPAPARTGARYRFARLGDRFIAFVLDIALLFGLFAIVDAWVIMRWAMFDGTELQLTTASLVIAVTLNATILFLYGWLLEAACGATLGKALVGIRIVRTTQRGALAACAVRNLLRIVDGLGFYLVGAAVACCSDIRQRVGDMCAHTAVVEDRFGIGIRIAAFVLWIMTMAGAGWAVPRICSANVSVHPRYLSQVVVRIGRTADSAYFHTAGFTLDVHSSTTR
ncbi:MAG TPA: RDD family protein [Candidatus Dormibacteraeota bacterium]|nr:RDD family protein [Candidatus Dormibacteraeota bacterium]